MRANDGEKQQNLASRRANFSSCEAELPITTCRLQYCICIFPLSYRNAAIDYPHRGLVPLRLDSMESSGSCELVELHMSSSPETAVCIGFHLLFLRGMFPATIDAKESMNRVTRWEQSTCCAAGERCDDRNPPPI